METIGQDEAGSAAMASSAANFALLADGSTVEIRPARPQEYVRLPEVVTVSGDRL